MTQIDIRQAKERFQELVDLAVRGEEVIICKDELPLVRLAPITARKRQRQFGSAKGLITLREDFDDPLGDFKELE
jgi:antitoxin (DNA-binding transcriptional repressor) of toxin-antitoxin stability system